MSKADVEMLSGEKVTVHAREPELALLVAHLQEQELLDLADLRTANCVYCDGCDNKGYLRRGWWLDGRFLGPTSRKAARKLRKWHPRTSD
jgi:hypothetical protein